MIRRGVRDMACSCDANEEKRAAGVVAGRVVGEGRTRNQLARAKW